MADKTYDELEPMLLKLLEEGHTWYAKFTCAHCGARQVFSEPNLLYTSGICEECNKTSKLTRWGFLVIMSSVRR